jgi:hypothetical protein
MRYLSFFLFLSLGLGVVACYSSKNTTSSTTTTPTMDARAFGAKVKAKGAITYDQMLANMSDKKEMPAKIEGKVEGVCQVKGCWMNIVSDQPNQPKMMVKFKDYGFFVPKDLSGHKVVIEGVATRSVTSVEELRHYAEDAGKSAAEIAAITKPKEELKFLATGVIVLD